MKPQESSKVHFLRPSKLFIGLYLAVAILLFLYSFTQIDLGLTLTRASFFATIQQAFQYIGYFNRPLSASLFSILMLFLLIFYISYLVLARRNALSSKSVWITVISLTIILSLSYTAFSYDIFNYIFDAKIITEYNENPYFKKALDYPQDPMLAFMHWTHRTYPYGPTWLVVTVPLSFLGLNYFLPTYFLFKILAAISYLGSVFAISRIMRVVSPKHELSAMLLFALNPLVIVESLISGHNDIVMMCICLFSILFLVKRKYIFGIITLLFSIGIKYATGFLLPLFLSIMLFDRRKVPIQWDRIFITFLVAMTFALGAAVLRTTFQPWYLLFLLPISALLVDKYYITIPTIVLTIGALLNYLPFLYLGHWDNPVPTILLVINISSVILSGIITFSYYLRTIKSTRTDK